MSILPVGSTPFLPSLPSLTDAGSTTGASATGASATGGAGSSTGASGTGFSDMISNALDGVQGTQQNADGLATQAATGGLTDVQDYLIATTQATVDTQITAAVRDKALQAFQSIMGMPV